MLNVARESFKLLSFTPIRKILNEQCLSKFQRQFKFESINFSQKSFTRMRIYIGLT